MKVSEAEKLVCPFMLYQESSLHELYNTTCITTKCMAWKSTTENLYSPYCDKCKRSFNLDKKIKICINCETRFEQSGEIPKDKQEGYCQRLSNV